MRAFFIILALVTVVALSQTREVVNVGASVGDTNSDTARSGFVKLNNNDEDLFQFIYTNKLLDGWRVTNMVGLSLNPSLITTDALTYVDTDGVLSASDITITKATQLATSTNALQPQLDARAVQVATLTDLIALGAAGVRLASTAGYHAQGDGGAGLYRWTNSLPSGVSTNRGAWFAGSTGFWSLVHDGSVNVKQFGAKGDGATDDSAAIQSALDDAGVAELAVPNGVFIADGLTIARGVKIAGSGTIKKSDDTRILNVSIPYVTHSVSSVEAAEVTITSAFTCTAITIADGTGFKSGDVVKLVSETPYPGAQRGVTYNGEFAVVSTVTNNVIYTSAPIRLTYSDNVRLAKYSMTDEVVVDGVTFEGEGVIFTDTGTASMVSVTGAVSPKFRNVKFLNNKTRMLQLFGCFQAVVDGCEFRNGGNDPGMGQFSYGVECIAGEGAVISGCIFSNLRHGYDSAAGAEFSPPSAAAFTGPNQYDVVSGCNASGCSNSGFSSHEGSYGIQFIGNVNRASYRRASPGNGFTFRGERITAIGNTDYGSRQGFNIFMDARHGGIDDIQMIDNFSFGNEEAPIRISLGASGEPPTVPTGIGRVLIQGGIYESKSVLMILGAVTNLTIRGVEFRFIEPASTLEQTNSVAAIDVENFGSMTWIGNIHIEDCIFDLSKSASRVTRLLSNKRPSAITAKNNKIITGGKTLAVVWNTTESTSTLYAETTTIDDVHTVAANSSWSSARMGFRGAVDTRYITRGFSGLSSDFRFGRNPFLDGNVGRWIESETTYVMTRTSFASPYDLLFESAEAGAFPGQRIRLSHASTARSPGIVRLASTGAGVTTLDGRDVVLTVGDSATLTWSGSTWLAESSKNAFSPWHSSLGALSIRQGAGASTLATNTIRATITGTNWMAPEPFSVVYIGEIPNSVPENSIGLISVGETATEGSSSNVFGILLRSGNDRFLTVLAHDDVSDISDIDYSIQAAMNSRSTQVIASRGRGTNVYLSIDGASVTPASAGVPSDFVLPEDPILSLGVYPGYAGEFQFKHRAAAFLPYAVLPGTALRILENGIESLQISSGAVVAATNIVQFHGVELATATPIRKTTQGITGLTVGVVYYVRHYADNYYTLHATAADAWADDDILDLTSETAGVQWSVEPVAVWVLEDESSGTITDRTGNGHNATASGAFRKL